MTKHIDLQAGSFRGWQGRQGSFFSGQCVQVVAAPHVVRWADEWPAQLSTNLLHMPTRCINRPAQINSLGSLCLCLCLGTLPAPEVGTFIPPARLLQSIHFLRTCAYVHTASTPTRAPSCCSRDRPDKSTAFSQRARAHSLAAVQLSRLQYLYLFNQPWPIESDLGADAILRPGAIGDRDGATTAPSCNIASPPAPCPQCPACPQIASGRVSAAPREAIDSRLSVGPSLHTHPPAALFKPVRER
jgi:hypothetical protein